MLLSCDFIVKRKKNLPDLQLITYAGSNEPNHAPKFEWPDNNFEKLQTVTLNFLKYEEILPNLIISLIITTYSSYTV